ncbi:condensin complex subunit 3 isoform X1 [Erpetoichthys calabaricus]|uniref:condensin complex subunit 3 isoform X1 n=1 Tax=Erpetoichthys calabaricus TaxID=27687 RepID=UPI00109F800B|nr:condensin complex subunit 3 isoform X1 [Erpetoichthys calabaricus]
MSEKKPLEIKEAFEMAQKSHSNKAKLAAALKQKYTTLENKTTFHEEFVHYMKYAMIVYKREPAVESVIDFVAKFATSFEETQEDENSIEEEEDENPFLNYLFDFLLKSHNANSHAVRFRVCQLINKLLGNMSENAQIDDDIFDRIHETMLVRVKDKFPNVRIQAVLAMARLQDPKDDQCPTINAYMQLIESDSNPEVRRAILSCIAPSAKTLPKILGRIRDVKDKVRELSYKVLAEKVHVNALTIAQRVKILQQGLNDRSVAVKEAVQKNLLQAWLRLMEGNVLDLLHKLDVENSAEVPVTALNALFALSPLNELAENFSSIDERKLIPVENLTCENALYWRALCEYIKSRGEEGEEILERLLPEAAIYIEYLHKFLKSIPVLTEEQKADFKYLENVMTKEFIGQQLVILVGCLDTAEEGGRKRVLIILQEILVSPNCPTSLVLLLIEKLLTILKDDDKRIQITAEIISEIREPSVSVAEPASAQEASKRQVKLAEVKVKLIEAKQKLEECVVAQDFSLASQLKDQIMELENTRNQLNKEMEEPEIKVVNIEKNDPETLLKCLTICSELLKQMSIDKGIGPTMNEIFNSLILPSIANAHPAVRNMAVICLGSCALQSKDLANRHLLLLLQIAQLDVAKIRISAIKAVLDQLLLNGLEALQGNTYSDEENSEEQTEKENSEEQTEEKDGNEEDNIVNNILALLSGFLDSEISELRTEAAEGLAKLMFSGRLRSAKLLSRLVLLWYNPVTEDDTRLRHCLGVFFPLFAYASRSNQECFEDSFLPTMHTLFNAPGSSPLAEVDFSNVAELLVDLTRPSGLSKQNNTEYQGPTVHESLAARLCNEILKDPSAPDVRIYAKCLGSLEYEVEDPDNYKDILLLLEEIVTEVKDKVSLKAIEKVINQLKGENKGKAVMNDTQVVNATDQGVAETSKAEIAADENDLLKTVKKSSKRGQKTASTATRSTRSSRARKATDTYEESSDQDEGPRTAPEPPSRPSRRAKLAAIEKTRMNLTHLINQEADQPEDKV